MADATKQLQIVISAKDEASRTISGVGSSVSSLAKQATAGSAIILGSFGLIAKSMIQAGAEFQSARVSFETFLGSGEKAGKLLKELSDFAVETPFDLPQVIEGSKQLLAYGIEAGKVTDTFRMLGDLSQGSNDRLGRLTLAFGQVKAATKLTGAELRQFSEAGVPLLDILAKQMGKTTGAVQEMISEGTVKFEDVQKALLSLTSEGGRFFNNMKNQSKTFLGVMSNTRDEFIRFALNVLGFTEQGEIRKGSIFYYLQIGAEKALEAIKVIRPFAQQFVDFILGNGPALAAVFGALIALLVPLIGAFIGLIAPALAFMAAGAAIAAVGMLIVQNWGLIQPVLQPVIDAFAKLYIHMREIVDEMMERLGPNLAEMGEAFSEFWITIQPLMPALKILGAIIAALAIGPLVMLLGILTGVIQALTMVLPYVVQFYTGIIQIVTGFFQLLIGIFTLNGELIMESMRTMWDGIRNLFLGSFFTLLAAVAGFINGIITFFQTLYDVLVGKSIIPDMVIAIIAWFGKLPAAITAILTNLQKAFTEKFDAIWTAVKGWKDNVVGAFNQVADSVNNAINALKNAAKAGVKGVTGLSFQHGGFVPGSYDQAVPAVLHGGERVVPRTGVDVANQNTGMGGGVTLNFSGPIQLDSPARVQELADKIIAILGRQNELAARGVGY